MEGSWCAQLHVQKQWLVLLSLFIDVLFPFHARHYMISSRHFASAFPSFYTLRPRQNGRHFPDIFKRIFLNENIRILIKISLKFVPQGPINNIPAMAQIMFWLRPGNKPLSEPMMVRLPMHICVTRPQWVNANWPWYSSPIGQFHACWFYAVLGHPWGMWSLLWGATNNILT